MTYSSPLSDYTCRWKTTKTISKPMASRKVNELRLAPWMIFFIMAFMLFVFLENHIHHCKQVRPFISDQVTKRKNVKRTEQNCVWSKSEHIQHTFTIGLQVYPQNGSILYLVSYFRLLCMNPRPFAFHCVCSELLSSTASFRFTLRLFFFSFCSTIFIFLANC